MFDFNFKIYDVITWSTNNGKELLYIYIYIYILPNINQAMKLGQLTKYNKGYIFLQKLCRK